MLEKALESLRAAELCFQEKMYNSTANRAYYAMFQAAVFALEQVGVKPKADQWAHSVLQSTFTNELTRNRKLYPHKFAAYLSDALVVRNQADYRQVMISTNQARSLLKWAQEIVKSVAGGKQS